MDQQRDGKRTLSLLKICNKSHFGPILRRVFSLLQHVDAAAFFASITILVLARHTSMYTVHEYVNNPHVYVCVGVGEVGESPSTKSDT